jgi:segregation and condensation protein A
METPPSTETPPATGDYKVRLDIFEGPMDLLLHLIKVNEMDIQDIRISTITQQYFSYLRLMEQLDLEVAGDFLVMASTLINIKLRSLLPETHEEEDEAEAEDDFMTAQALMDKLVEYRRFKEAAAALRESEMAQSNRFFRDVALPRLADAETDNELQMDLDALLGAFTRVLRFVERRDWHLVTEEEYSVEEKMDWIEQRLLLDERIEIDELFKSCRSKVEMIVVLLAALELCHLRRLCVAQSDAYGSILIFPQTEGPQPVDEAPVEELPTPDPRFATIEADDDETADEPDAMEVEAAPAQIVEIGGRDGDVLEARAADDDDDDDYDEDEDEDYDDDEDEDDDEDDGDDDEDDEDDDEDDDDDDEDNEDDEDER